jgi:tRNA(Ile)-lysidine synthase
MLDLPLTTVRLDPSGSGKGRPSEERMRHLRLTALAAAARDREVETVVLGHTRDDLVETVLHRAVRGTGLTGLAAMRPVVEMEGVRVVRPLLSETREALHRFLRDHGVAWDEDETNAELDATRNRIRHVVRPLLAREVNRRSDEALARLAEHAAQDDAQIEADVDAELKKSGLTLATAERLPLDWIRGLSPSLRRRVLRRWLMALGESPLPPPSRHIEEIIDKITAPSPPPRWTTFRALTLGVQGDSLRVWLPDRLEISRWPQISSPTLALPTGQDVDLGRGWSIRAESIELSEARALLEVGTEVWTALLDSAQLDPPLMIRPRRSDDRFQPLGFGHTKELRKFMRDAGLPRCVRSHLPLVCDAERVLWVPGGRISDTVRITDTTEAALRIRIRRAPA